MASSSDSESNKFQPRRRTISYEFVWLYEKQKCTPRGKDWDQLNRNGRVKEISVAISMKAQQVTDPVRDSFPELRNADLTKIRVYKSFSRGSKMERVFSGIPDAKSIKETFKKPSSKRVYLYLKTDTPASPQHLTCVTNAASGSGDSIPPVSQPNRVSTVIIADNRTPPTTEADSLSPVVPVQHNPISPSSTIPNLSLPETRLDHPLSLTQLDPTQDGALIDFSRSTSTVLIDADPQTHQLLVHDESDYEDNDLLQNIFDDNIVEIDPVYEQGSQLAAMEPPRTAGVIEEDLRPCGIADVMKGKVLIAKMDRTQEVQFCEKELMESNTHKPLPVFLNLFFDETCHQARTDERMLVCVVLKQQDSINNVQRLLSFLENERIYFWVAKSGTTSGRQVVERFGSNSEATEVYILAPTSSRPVLVERYSGETLQKVTKEDVLDAVRQGQASLEGLRRERKRLEIRQSQEEDLRKSLIADTKKIEAKDEGSNLKNDHHTTATNIREERRKRIEPEPEEGITIVLRFKDMKESRKFGKKAMFQEVYDWAGAMSAMPLHFTIQRRSEVVLHNQPIERHEVLDIYDRVSFKGNQPTDVQSELETTSTDVQSELETTFNAKFNERGLKATGSMISSKEQETRVDSKKRRKKEKRSGSQRKKVKKP
ncbi:uncharacterized protein LOC114952477 isoform X2 [Acropora millepora]|uniref:uncharacterized protein LOC114952477 isoform X2 n=1 Tax=Acropora millepora TaxID=45264 RepID=UPI001CF1488D|nr:uncharacterized protein LOC114952477 isoform X2 [Acropora millepora]